jgi:hypothetical protein
MAEMAINTGSRTLVAGIPKSESLSPRVELSTKLFE